MRSLAILLIPLVMGFRTLSNIKVLNRISINKNTRQTLSLNLTPTVTFKIDKNKHNGITSWPRQITSSISDVFRAILEWIIAFLTKIKLIKAPASTSTKPYSKTVILDSKMTITEPIKQPKDYIIVSSPNQIDSSTSTSNAAVRTATSDDIRINTDVWAAKKLQEIRERDHIRAINDDPSSIETGSGRDLRVSQVATVTAPTKPAIAKATAASAVSQPTLARATVASLEIPPKSYNPFPVPTAKEVPVVAIKPRSAAVVKEVAKPVEKLSTTAAVTTFTEKPKDSVISPAVVSAAVKPQEPSVASTVLQSASSVITSLLTPVAPTVIPTSTVKPTVSAVEPVDPSVELGSGRNLRIDDKILASIPSVTALSASKEAVETADDSTTALPTPTAGPFDPFSVFYEINEDTFKFPTASLLINGTDATTYSMQDIKSLGISGTLGYIASEVGFWAVSVPIIIASYHTNTGEWLDIGNPADRVS